MNSALTNNYLEQGRVNDDTNKEHLVSNIIHVREALLRGLSARKRMTENNPVTSGGQYFYGDVVRALRELLKSSGYEKESTRNVELTINKNKAIAIYLCSGCEQTGNPLGVPQSSTDKGDFTLELFGLNYDNAPNLDLFPELLPLSNPKNKLNCDIWFLLHNFDKSNNMLKAELTRPISYDKKGYVTGFDLENRIIIDMERDEIISIKPDFNEDIDFEIDEISKDNV
ncbi:hypothetical protein L2729_02200 [Shewanella gelidimarina]|uniref:hypothetical protein n=1 Tax=Shewanella gelidimarina TaxID=56813 RepID=UPI00200DEF88|nr:hypothetical protein [Shewanella gelidimarina]MCL1056802.1 hypothetical protein [Shewanella gelidimarina]